MTGTSRFHLAVLTWVALSTSAVAQPSGCLSSPSAAASATATVSRVVDLPIGGVGVQRVLFLAPPCPVATLVMLPGGAGEVGIERNGSLRHDDNFVVRTRAQWVGLGYAVLVSDTIGDANLRGMRSSPAYAAVVQHLVDFAHRQSSAPVFLLGTSQGSIAAMNGAAHARAGTVAGVVLTESVTQLGGSGETVFSADPPDVRVPALVVANRDDRCEVAPPQDAPRIAAAMTHAPNVKVLMVSGGTDRSGKACGSLTPHGYDGIEPSVIGQIDTWIRAQIAGRP